MAENKTKPNELSVADFTNGLTDQTRRADAKVPGGRYAAHRVFAAEGRNCAV